MIVDALSEKKLWLRAIVAGVSLLSMIGALLIVLSYVCISSIRTRSREILVHLSLADFGVACANFIGVVVDFDRFLRECPYQNNNWCPDVYNLCKVQALFAGFFTIASILWTMALSVYIYLLVVHAARNLHSKSVYFFYVFCWGIPLFISLWLVITDRLGHSDRGGSGWCSLKIDEKRSTAILVTFLGNDLWIYLTVVVVTVLYFTTHCHIKHHAYLQGTLQSRPINSAVVSNMDVKFLLIPLAFLLLRIGSITVVVVFVYAGLKPTEKITYALLCLAGVGDCGQGFVNAVLFCAFTAKVREKFKLGVARLCLLRCCWKSPYNYDLQHPTHTTYSSTEETTR